MTEFTPEFSWRISGHSPTRTLLATSIRIKRAHLLVYLALEPQAHTRTHLATLLWSEIGETHARTNLRNTLHRLRKTLDDAASGGSDQLLTVARKSVRFNADERHH